MEKYTDVGCLLFTENALEYKIFDYSHVGTNQLYITVVKIGYKFQYHIPPYPTLIYMTPIHILNPYLTSILVQSFHL
jgi:hypothetical protein